MIRKRASLFAARRGQAEGWVNLKDLALNFLLARGDAPEQDAAGLAERLDGMNRLAHTLGVGSGGFQGAFA